MRPDPAVPAAEVRDRALAEGFDLVSIASCGRIERDRRALGEWLRRGYDASMTWIERTRRQREDPRELLRGCRSIVCVAMNHAPPEGTADAAGGRRWGKVARYARGRDYHKVLGNRLRRLAEWLATRTGAPARSFVDTGPVLERGWAQRAGLGWIGKNANLLTRSHGSWLLLGEILSAADLEADDGPHADFCGTCTACIGACPTGAIVEPGVVDSRRCISYWTIEHRGPVPRDRREGNGTWMFGCDDCQTVCPWNRSFARPVEGDPFGFRADLEGLDPTEILGMDETMFRGRFSGTSLMRAKWEGMRRNACIALGNRRDPAAVAPLASAIEDPDPVVRAHAVWALGRIGGDAAGAALASRLGREDDPAVRVELAAAIAGLRDDAAGP